MLKNEILKILKIFVLNQSKQIHFPSVVFVHSLEDDVVNK